MVCGSRCCLPILLRKGEGKVLFRSFTPFVLFSEDDRCAPLFQLLMCDFYGIYEVFNY